MSGQGRIRYEVWHDGMIDLLRVWSGRESEKLLIDF